MAPLGGVWAGVGGGVWGWGGHQSVCLASRGITSPRLADPWGVEFHQYKFHKQATYLLKLLKETHTAHLLRPEIHQIKNTVGEKKKKMRNKLLNVITSFSLQYFQFHLLENPRNQI